MKITTQVKLTMIFIWVSTFVLIFLGTIFIGRAYVTLTYGSASELSSFYSVDDPFRDMYQKIESVKATVKNEIKEDPTVGFDKKFLEKLNTKCQEMNTSIVVKVDDKYIYLGADNSSGDLTKSLDETDENERSKYNSFVEYVISSPSLYMVNQYDYKYNGQHVSVYLLTYYGAYVERFRQMLWAMLLMIVCVLLFLSTTLSAVVYIKFVKPLEKLKNAAEEIGSGNLDVEIEVNEKRADEIGELCRSFNDMKDRLNESVNMKMQYEVENRELISNISHDLKTPITTIKGYVEGIIDGVADTPERRERYLKMIYNKANEMDVLINELSLYTNITNNSIPYEFHRVGVKDYFNDCMEEVQATLASYNMELTYENTCGDDVKVLVDPDQLKRVVNNIITNAIKYRDENSEKVEIKICEKDSYVEISIEDDGKGIDKENLPHIFDRTFREDSARRSKGGSGLGLAICKKIVEEHGGEIWADSEKGQGTTISFTLKKYIKEESKDE